MTATAEVKEKKDFSITTYSEVCTAGGQMVTIQCRSEDVEKITEILKEDIKYIDVPVTGRVKNVSHGGYGRYTRYDIAQHKYAGGDCESGGDGGFIEALEIKNPPENRCGFIIHEYNSGTGSIFYEFSSVEEIIKAWEENWGNMRNRLESFKKYKGFKRKVECRELNPWFYAIGDELLIGDYAVCSGMEDDPVYRLGKKFIVYDKYDEDAVPTIKTCLGTKVFKEETDDGYGRKTGISMERIVHWDDGTVWRDDFRNSYKTPRVLEEGEAWIEKAVIHFKELLIGKRTKFSIKFTNGDAFHGTLKTLRKNKCSPEGRYTISARVKFKDKQEVKEGYVDFVPKKDFPDIITWVTEGLKAKGYEVISIEVKGKKVERGGKKWSGVFFER